MEQALREVGLSEREAKCYLALLELGQSTVGPIAAKTRIQHAKIYQTLEKLIDKGLVSYVIKSKTKNFSAQNPKHLVNLLKEKERAIEDILPELNAKQAFSKEKQIATVYEGYKAIKAMYESVLDELDRKGYYYVFAFKDEYGSNPLAARFLRNVHMRLAEKKVEDRMIAHRFIKNEILQNYSGIRNMKIRFSNTDVPLGLMVINDRVINWTWGERPTAVEIVSKQIAQHYKKFFLEMWEQSKKIK